jgi:hypothetical protein
MMGYVYKSQGRTKALDFILLLAWINDCWQAGIE